MGHIQMDNTAHEFLADLERAEQAQRPRFPARLVEGWVRELIRRSREAGEQWTDWRKFYCNEEATGNARCQCKPRMPYCTRIAIYVSYNTTTDGRVVICQGCFEERYLKPHVEKKTAERIAEGLP